MPNNALRLSTVPGKGGFLRIAYRTVAGGNANLVVLPSLVFTHESDPRLEEMTEGDSLGSYMAPTLEMHVITVDLRRRNGSVDLDALGIRSLSFVDAVGVDIGNSGYCDIFAHMGVGPYRRGNDQKTLVMEGFTLMGGATYARKATIPAWLTTTGAIPLLTGYSRSGVTLPSDI